MVHIFLILWGLLFENRMLTAPCISINRVDKMILIVSNYNFTSIISILITFENNYGLWYVDPD